MQKRIVLPDSCLKKLVKEVRRRECLWNPHHDRYNDRYQMSKSWKEIAEVMQLPEDRIRMKWKNLRNLFSQEIKKIGPDEQYTGKWRHFPLMQFLTKIAKNTMNNGRINKRINENNKTIENDDSNSVEETKEESVDEEDVVFEVEEQDTEENNESEVYLHDDFEENPIPEKMPKLSHTEEDYDIMFLKTLAPYFRQLDPIRKLVVRSKMQDMLLNEIAAQTTTNQLNAKKS